MSTISNSASTQKSDLDLSKPDDVLAYLSGTPFAATRVELVSARLANFIFRLYLVTPFDHEKTVILKHAKSWAAPNDAFKLGVERQSIEALAMKHVYSFLPSDALVIVPKVFHHDPTANVLIMEDVGPEAKNLKDLLRASPLSESASRELGTALGRFLVTIHAKGSADMELLEGVRANTVGRQVTSWITYGRLVDTLKAVGQGTGLVESPLDATELPSEEQFAEITALTKDKIKRIYEAQTVFTMGDFWTGNVVARLKDNGDVDRAFVIDWEVSKPGLAYLDVAQFAAEMHTIRRIHPEANESVEALLNAYEEAYKQGTGVLVDEPFVRSAASHVGAHMITITPTVADWGSKERTREVVKEGIEYVLGGLSGDSTWLETSAVGRLLPRTSQ